MRFTEMEVTFNEVPDEIALTFLISGCPLKCKGCHSEYSWSLEVGTPLTETLFKKKLEKFQGFITTVCFLGGEWHQEALIERLKIAQKAGLKTCLYSGFERVSLRIMNHLDFLKLGRWIEEKGGLDSKATNQRFIDLKKEAIINHKFIK